MKNSRCGMAVGVAVVLLVVGTAMFADSEDTPKKTNQQPLPQQYKRDIKKVGEGSKHLIKNRKAITKSKYPPAKDSFASKEYKQKTSSKLQEMFENSFSDEAAKLDPVAEGSGTNGVEDASSPKAKPKK